jgi:cell division protein FtsQ
MVVASDPDAMRLSTQSKESKAARDSSKASRSREMSTTETKTDTLAKTNTDRSSGVLSTVRSRFYRARNQLFRVRDISLQGVLSIREDTLLNRLGPLMDHPMFELNLELLARKLEAHNRIESAELIRRLPGSLEVRVTERRELALILHNGELIGVDEHGVVLSPPEPGWPLDAPLITGAKLTPVIGDTVAAENLLTALKWIRMTSSNSRVQSWISEVRVGPSGVEWIGGVNGWRVTPGRHPVGAQVATLDAFLAKRGFEGRSSRELDLRFPGFLIVREGS